MASCGVALLATRNRYLGSRRDKPDATQAISWGTSVMDVEGGMGFEEMCVKEHGYFICMIPSVASCSAWLLIKMAFD